MYIFWLSLNQDGYLCFNLVQWKLFSSRNAKFLEGDFSLNHLPHENLSNISPATSKSGSAPVEEVNGFNTVGPAQSSSDMAKEIYSESNAKSPSEYRCFVF